MYTLGHFEEESREREEICRLRPKDAYARHNYALSLLLAGKFAQAEEQFIITLQLDPSQTRAHNNYGQLLFLFRKDVEAATKHYLLAIEYDKDINEISRYLHNYCIVLSLGVQEDSKAKLEWIRDNVISKKFAGKFRKKNIDMWTKMVDAYILLNQAKILWIENAWDQAVQKLEEASKIYSELGLSNFSASVKGIINEVLLTREIASAVEELSIEPDIKRFTKKIEVLSERCKGLKEKKEKIKISFPDGLCYGINVLFDLLEVVDLFSRSLKSSLSYFSSAKTSRETRDTIKRNVWTIHRLTAHNFSYFGRQLAWVLDSLWHVIDKCDQEIRDLASDDLRLKKKQEYWLRFAKSLSAFRIDISHLGSEIPAFQDFSFNDSTLAKLNRITVSLSAQPEVASDIKMSNHLFKSLTRVPIIFQENIESINEICTPCLSEKSFKLKIGALAQLFEVPLDPLRKIVRNPDSQWKSIRLLEAWLQQSNLKYNNEMLDVWRNIRDLRNAFFPYHPSDDRIVNIVRFFGLGFPIDYPKLWEAILRRFLEGLKSFQKALSAKVV